MYYTGRPKIEDIKSTREISVNLFKFRGCFSLLRIRRQPIYHVWVPSFGMSSHFFRWLSVSLAVYLHWYRVNGLFFLCWAYKWNDLNFANSILMSFLIPALKKVPFPFLCLLCKYILALHYGLHISFTKAEATMMRIHWQQHHRTLDKQSQFTFPSMKSIGANKVPIHIASTDISTHRILNKT